jgi:acyl carrier protein
MREQMRSMTNRLGYNWRSSILLLSVSMSASPPVTSATNSSFSVMTEAELALAEIVVKTLNLEVAANEIDPDAPIYGEGLGLDSIDILEISLAISKQYGFQLKSDDENNKTIYKSLRNLSAHIEKSRTK